MNNRILKEADTFAKRNGIKIDKIVGALNDIVLNGDIEKMVKDLKNDGKKILHKKVIENEVCYRVNYSKLN